MSAGSFSRTVSGNWAYCRPCAHVSPVSWVAPLSSIAPVLLVSHVSLVSTVASVSPFVPCVHCYLCDPCGLCGHRGNRTRGNVTCTLDPPLDPLPLQYICWSPHTTSFKICWALSYKFAAFFAFSPFMSSFARFVIHTVFVIFLVSFCQNFSWIIFLLKRTATRCLATHGVTQSEHLLEGLS